MHYTDVFPLQLNWLVNLPFKAFIDVDKSLPRFISRFNVPLLMDPDAIADKTVPKSEPIKVVDVLPRVGEGCAFVKLAHDPAKSVEEIEARIKKYLKENPIRPWFNPFRRVRMFLVRGKPWLEDLYRVPSSRIKVEFVPTTPGNQAQELGQETLYSLFRRYGKMAEIIAQPADSKDMRKYAILQFNKTRSAVTAKNCMHGYKVGSEEGGGDTGTVLKIAYQQTRRAHWIWDWLVNHPRITLPLLLAIVGTVTVAVFDPIRTFFIKNHITRTFHITDNRVYKWLSSQASKANAILMLKRNRPEDAGLRAIWDDRKDDIESIQAWLMETPDTFIVVQGPRGSGKKELVVDQALKGRKNTLLVDCKPIQEARGDSATICAAAAEVGYRPVFSWMNSINSLIDLAAQGTIGTKTGFSETLDTQLAKILQNTRTALRQVALEDRKQGDKDTHLSDDEWLEAHTENLPVVIIDNFLHKSQESSVVYDKISEWAAGLTTSNVAHVIFLTTDVSFSKSLSKALPDRTFRQIALGDTSPQVAKKFVINHLDADAQNTDGSGKNLLPSQIREDLAELDECISTLGGRLTDLEFVARRIKAGETPKKAVREIIEQSASEILKMYILDVDRSRKWTPEQAWLLVKLLADKESISYNEVLLSDIYTSAGENALQALEQAELITIVSSNGRPNSIKPSRPVYSAAFYRLTEDHVLKARLDLAILSELTKIETARIDKTESELNLLGQLPGQPSQVKGRVAWLLSKLSASQNKVEQYEKESAGLKKTLQNEF